MRKITFYISCLILVNVNMLLGADLNIVDLDNIATESEDFTIWIALFGLGIIAIFALFLSSEQLKNFKDSIKKRDETKEKINQAQDQILSNMSENIQNIAQETVSTAKKIADAKEKNNIENDLEKVVNSETQLLAITVNLIEFLRLKSKKIKIVNEEFKLSNLLNDVTGMLHENSKNLKFELIYDVKSNISEKLYGDTLNLSKILSNVLLFCVENAASEIIVEISKDKKDELVFNIKSDLNINLEDSENIFNANYDEEKNTYDSLGMFIAKELTSLMGEEIVGRNTKHSLAEFIFSIPYKCENDEKPINILDTKNILLVDSSTNSANVIKSMLLELEHKTKILSKDEFLQNTPSFNNFDIVLIDEELFNDEVIKKLQNSDVKVVSLNKTFKKLQEQKNLDIVDIVLNKPVTREQLSSTIKELYKVKSKDNKKNTIKNDKTPLLIHRNTFEDTDNIEITSFAIFRKIKILLVEDNLINQKVFLGVLAKSGINIDVANDGQEALNILDKNDNKYDIIFMDINMPIMDGYVAATKIREDKRFDNIPIIALSALTSVSEIDKMFTCGMNGYLAKPLKKAKLYTVFNIFVHKQSPDRRTQRREEEKIYTLDGLNIKRGISQANESEIFYKEILAEFKDAYSKSDDVFENLVNDFRYEQLRMLCVDINGLSGAIGAEDLHDLTTRILQKFANKQHEFLPTFIQEYKKELTRVNVSIDRYLS